MNPRISFITIGVRDLDSMKSFYNTAFGWQPVKDSDGIVFYRLNGFILALFPSGELAEDIGIENDGAGFRQFSLAINFTSREQVDDAFSRMTSNGARAVKNPEPVFWGGYRGYIADPEGNYWELAHNPFLVMDTDGNVVTHT